LAFNVSTRRVAFDSARDDLRSPSLFKIFGGFMQIHSEKQTAIPEMAEFIKALDIVVNLAEGNCLDPTDPDMEDDPDLLKEANSQLSAIDTINEFLSMLVSGSLYLGFGNQCSLPKCQSQTQLTGADEGSPSLTE
jgi:hypothetical protein